MDSFSTGLLECSALEKRKNHELRKYIHKLEFNNHILKAQQEVSQDGILVVDDQWNMISFNQRFVDMWKIPAYIQKSRDDKQSIQTVLDRLKHPDKFLARVEYLMDNPDRKSWDELELIDGRFFDRYSAPILGKEKKVHGRIWFFRDITEIKQTRSLLEQQKDMLEERVQMRTLELEKLNDTLGVLLHSLEKEKIELEETTTINFQETLLPFFDMLKETPLSGRQQHILDMMEHIFSDLLSSMNSSLQHLRHPLTPTEMKVANSIQAGKTTKEIAALLCCSERTVEGHRSAIRRKIGLHKGDNLLNHLRSFT